MPVSRVAGFALAELIMGLVLISLVGLVLVQASLRLERLARAERQSSALQLALDGGLQYLTSELEETGRGSAGTDLLRLAPDSLSYRASRGAGLACRVGPTEVVVLVDRFDGARQPQAGRDSLLLFTGFDSLGTRTGGWAALPILGVGSGNCAGRPALRLATALDTLAIPPAALSPLTPVRVFEIMQARLYSSLGVRWLGARSESAGEAIQPLAGPFDSTGVAFAYFDSLQQPSLAAAGVRSVRIHLSGPWSSWPGSTGARTDSAGQLLAPRNQ